ncbi:4Fe-4S dicluster domain-containing protein [Chloroflexota bacterium]
MTKKEIQPNDISRNPDETLVDIRAEDLMPLPSTVDRQDEQPPIKPLTEEQKEAYENSLDGVSVINIPKPQTKEEEEKLVESFLKGLKKLLEKENNWAFWQQLMLTLDSCVKCQTCNEACPIYLSSGKQDIYRPTFRAEVVRRIKRKYLDKGGKFLAKLNGSDIELNWTTIARLAELSYRCTICRRCTTWCPLGSDNALVTHELRKLFSQEMNISTKELHESGSIQQLKVGGSTGIGPKAFMGMIEFMEEEIEEKTGKPVKIPVDKEGADILLIHNSGEFMSWLENPEAFAIIFEAAGLSWTLSSELGGQVMKVTRGRANPQMVGQLVKKKLEGE